MKRCGDGAGSRSDVRWDEGAVTLRLASAAGIAGLFGGASTGAGAMKRCDGTSGSRFGGTGAKLGAGSGAAAAAFSGACSKGDGAMNRCGAKLDSDSRDRFDSERNSGV